MQFSAKSLFFIASVAAQQAYNQILNPGANSVIQAGGGVQTITWTNLTSGNVSVALYSGSNPVVTVAPLTASVINTGTYLWTPETWLPSGNDYTIGIVDLSGSAPAQYSPFFTIQLCSTCSSSTRSTTSSFSAQTVSVSGLEIGTRTDAAYPVAATVATSTSASGSSSVSRAALGSGVANTNSVASRTSTATVPGLLGSAAASSAAALGSSANSVLSATATPTTTRSTSDGNSVRAGVLGLAGVAIAML